MHAVLCCAALLWNELQGDIIGRRSGSRLVATIMLTGSILLVFSPLTPRPYSYLAFSIVAATL